MFDGFLADFGAFVSYFAAGGAATVVYMLVYMAITPYREVELIKAQNQAAAIAFAGSLLGFMLPITALIQSAIDLVDFGMWSVVAIVIQVGAFFCVRLVFPRISERIEGGEVPAGTWLAAASVAAGMLNAACLS